MSISEAKQLDRIVSDIKTLDYFQKLTVLEKLVQLLKKTDSPEKEKTYSILDLKGCGKELWKNIDSNQFLETERNSWG